MLLRHFFKAGLEQAAGQKLEVIKVHEVTSIISDHLRWYQVEQGGAYLSEFDGGKLV